MRVADLRSPSFFGVSQRMDGVHDGPCHTVRWHPRDGNLLLTAGLDLTVKLFDLRRLEAPVHVFRGHCPYALARCETMVDLLVVCLGARGEGGDRYYDTYYCCIYGLYGRAVVCPCQRLWCRILFVFLRRCGGVL